MRILNLTPHIVRFAYADGYVVAYPPDSAGPARILEMEEKRKSIGVMPVTSKKHLGIAGLPEPEPDVFYIVSSIVGEKVKRPDVISPDTGPSAIRFSDGQIEAVTAWRAWV